MDNRLDKPLWAAAAATFEHLGFLLAEPEPGAGGPGSDGRPPGNGDPPGGGGGGAWWTDAPRASVGFRGPVHGHLALWVSSEVARSVAGTMLASDAPDEALVADTLGELSNVICGNVLQHLAGPDGEFVLSPPDPGNVPGPEAGRPEAEARMAVGPGRARVCLFVSPPGEGARP